MTPRKKIIIRSFIRIIIIITIVGGLYMFLSMTRISLPYRERPHWTIGHIAVAAVSEWPHYRILNDSSQFKYDESLELWIHVDSFGTQYAHAIGRTIYRDGERVRLVYITRTEKLLSLTRRRFLPNLRTQEMRAQTDALQDLGYGHQTIEVYYLQSLHRQRRRIERFFDADFDALRADGNFVWRGTIEIPAH